MPLDIASAEDAYSLGTVKWDEFITQFQAQWEAPNIISQEILRMRAMVGMGMMKPEEADKAIALLHKLGG